MAHIAFNNYRDEAKRIYDKYMLLYSSTFPTTPETAIEFIKLYNDSYRQELSELALNILSDQNLDVAVAREILDQNGLNVVLLFNNIIGVWR